MADDNRELGPLAALVGTWEGDQGVDVAPGADRGVMETRYRERAVFEPTGRVDNHEQVLQGLRYRMTAWRIGEDEPFHEELGYWLWDAANRQVLRCFMVPRGVTIVAGGTADAGAKSLSMSADVGSETYGICSNQFLDAKFKTVRYELTVDIEGDRWSYSEDTQLRIAGQSEIFHHTDKNTLSRAK